MIDYSISCSNELCVKLARKSCDNPGCPVIEFRRLLGGEKWEQPITTPPDRSSAEPIQTHGERSSNMPSVNAAPSPRPSDNSSSSGSKTPGAVSATLAQRGSTHGDFGDNAEIMQATKTLWHSHVGWAKLTNVQREALEMIAHKVGRILCGNNEFDDHWIDIAGYAKLAEDRCKDKVKK